MSLSDGWVTLATGQIKSNGAIWAHDAEVVFRRLVVEESIRETSATLQKWADSCVGGQFADIDYPPSEAKENTAPLYEHLERVRKLASAGLEEKEMHRSAYLATACAALAFYTSNDYTTSNWWHRELGLGLSTGRCLILLAAAGQSSAIMQSLTYIESIANVDLGHSGANQTDFAYIQLLWSLAGWKGPEASHYLAHAYAASRAVAQCTEFSARSGPAEGEGIRVDFSYSQHNPRMGEHVCSQLYPGTYGKVLLAKFFKMHRLLTGVLALTPESLRQVEGHLTEGLGWFAYAGKYDFHTLGRAIARQDEGGISGWSTWCDGLLQNASKPHVLEELKALAAGKVLTSPSFRGTRAFWTNDYLSHINEGFAVFCKTVSTRTVGTETGNGENLMGYYMGCGTYFVHTHGKEYENLQPVWHWQYLPGSTVEKIPKFNYPLVEWGQGAWGSHDFSGVISEGSHGVATMILTRQNIKESYKTIITLPNEMYCLGMAGDLTGTTYSVHTTVNQCWQDGYAVGMNQSGSNSINSGTLTQSDFTRVLHGGLAYEFLLPASVTMEMTTSRGSWGGINKSLSADEVSAPTFSLWINHPKSGGNAYAYSIHKREADVVKPTFVCTKQAQYICKKDVAAGAIFKAGEVVDLGVVKLIFDAPLAFIARFGASSLTLTIGDPTQKLDKIDVKLEWEKKTYNHVCELPTDGDYRGQSVTFTFTEAGVERASRVGVLLAGEQ
ncbi:hypothetical protein IAE37_000120 [Pseudomonas sp. S31]|uniref:polysaccharide lyase family 8 super-sandwich domain-containing protein n=1 Tax=Pseudomonas sp. S31 TaxID=1564473 RepID=UPI001911F3D6|nr:polysaccharide lyase family 8 super-sandwich domain-containing protein [Pseudomonas sp. S31]MBK4997844.1 hypothetical protein [Pseudomonas sp. S31]